MRPAPTPGPVVAATGVADTVVADTVDLPGVLTAD